MGALLSFLGGSAFRMIWGEVSAYFTRKQEHSQEVERMRLQEELDANRAVRQLEQLRLSAELKLTEIRVAGDVESEKLAGAAFVEAMKVANRPTGIWWVDAWNGCIRPSMATVALLLWVLALYQAGFAPTDWDKELIGGVLGFYIADRTLGKRGK